MKVTIDNKLRHDIETTVKGVNMLSRVKKELMKQLNKNIDPKKVEEFFNLKRPIDKFNNEEIIEILNIFYNYSNDERFNIEKIIKKQEDKAKEDVDSDYEIVNGARKKKSKDDIPRYYFDFDFKKEFSTEYDEKTQRVLMSLFRKTAKFENEHGKDLYKFNKEELKEVFRSLKSKTIRSLQNTVSTVERYIDFAKERGRTSLNYATTFDAKEKLEELLDKEAEENMIFDKDEILELAEDADNAQDGVILALLVDGVSNKNEFEELINLTKDDVDFDNKIIHVDGRQVPMSEQTYLLVKDALNPSIPYISIKEDQEKVRKYKVAEGDHVLRGLRGKNKVKPQIVSQRLLRVKEKYDYPYLTANTISYSGQLALARELIEDLKLSIDDAVLVVLERFGIPVNDSSKFYLKSRIEKYLSL